MKFILITSLVSMIYVFAMDSYTKISSRLTNSNINYSMVIVDVKGSVNEPGSYYVLSGSSYGEIISQAGGVREDADISSIDLSTQVKADTSIYVPSIIENGKININIANKEELKKIKGIGEVIASKIIQYRSINGDFLNIEDIKKVSGIGDNLYSKIIDYITI